MAQVKGKKSREQKIEEEEINLRLCSSNDLQGANCRFLFEIIEPEAVFMLGHN